MIAGMGEGTISEVGDRGGAMVCRREHLVALLNNWTIRSEALRGGENWFHVASSGDRKFL